MKKSYRKKWLKTSLTNFQLRTYVRTYRLNNHVDTYLRTYLRTYLQTYPSPETKLLVMVRYPFRQKMSAAITFSGKWNNIFEIYFGY